MSDAIGATIKAGADLLGSYWQKQATEDATREYARQQERGRQEIRQGYNDVSGLYDPYRQSGQVALSELQNLVYDPNQYQMPEDFSFGGTVQDYLDPSMAFQQQQMQNAVNASGASQGSLLSGANLKALQDRSAQLAQTDYGNAFNRQQTERGNAYTEYLNKFNMSQQMNSERYRRLADLTSQGFNATQGTANARFGGANQLNQNFQGGANMAAYGQTAPYTALRQGVDALTSPALMDTYGSLFDGGGGGTPNTTFQPSVSGTTGGLDYGLLNQQYGTPSYVDPAGVKQGNIGGLK